MKAKSRKRLLISSTSMLLVSALALGTATFAWFTNNKKVTAEGMQVTAAAAKGLQITGVNGTPTDGVADTDWGASYTFHELGTTLLNAVSVPYSTNSSTYNVIPANTFYPSGVSNTGILKSDNASNFSGWQTNTAYPSKSNTKGTEASAKNGYFAAYQVGVRMTEVDADYANGSTARPSVQTIHGKITMNATTADKNALEYMRVAVLSERTDVNNAISGEGIQTVMAKAADTTAVASLTGENANLAAEKEKVEGETETVGTDEVITYEWTFNGLQRTAPKYFTILVWFEGQDPECVDANISLTGKINAEFWYV